jgi:hypothetical protein
VRRDTQFTHDMTITAVPATVSSDWLTFVQFGVASFVHLRPQ